MPAATAVIPARLASTRLPGKPLLDRTGKPLIAHVIDRVRACKRVGRIVVATDDERIFDASRRFGAEAMMTGEHPNGTSRIAEVVERLGNDGSAGAVGDIIVNVQGDEPEIEPAVVDDLVAALEADPTVPMGTVASPFSPGKDPHDPNVVKVVLDVRGRAVYFSRSPIPYYRDVESPPLSGYLHHLGLYGYRRDFLLKYVTLPPTPLEVAEKLEQLRALEHGFPIAVAIAQSSPPGIDTPEQYEAFVHRVQSAVAR